MLARLGVGGYVSRLVRVRRRGCRWARIYDRARVLSPAKHSRAARHASDISNVVSIPVYDPLRKMSGAMKSEDRCKRLFENRADFNCLITSI